MRQPCGNFCPICLIACSFTDVSNLRDVFLVNRLASIAVSLIARICCSHQESQIEVSQPSCMTGLISRVDTTGLISRVGACVFWRTELVSCVLQYRQGREPQEAGGEEKGAQEGPGPRRCWWFCEDGQGRRRCYAARPFLGSGQEVRKVNHKMGWFLWFLINSKTKTCCMLVVFPDPTVAIVVGVSDTLQALPKP